MKKPGWSLIDAGHWASRKGAAVRRRGGERRRGQEWWGEPLGGAPAAGPFPKATTAMEYVEEHGKEPEKVLSEGARKLEIPKVAPGQWVYGRGRKRGEA